MRQAVRILILLLAATASLHGASAQQRPQGPRTRISGGLLQRPDTLRRPVDSLGRPLPIDSARIERLLDSLRSAAPDSLQRDTARIDSLIQRLVQTFTATDSLDRTRIDSLRSSASDTLRSAGIVDSTLFSPIIPPSRREAGKRRGGLFSDSMSLSKVCWTAAVLPGYGQIYNKQYWKLPVLYGALGTSIGLFIHESGKYRPLKRQYDAMIDVSTARTPELDQLQARMIRSNTRRQIYLFTAIGSYIYFLGDAAVNYSTNDVSSVKKATTLACICPGAGQIYNKSYWKVPFVVGGFASMIYCIDWNNRGYKRFRKAYNQRVAYDDALQEWQSGGQEGDRPVANDEFRGRYQATFLKNLKDNFRRNRDLCIIITAGIYVLQIVDAHVDAHLKDYDISDDLSLNLEPKIDYTYIPAAGGNRPVYGFNISLNF